MQYLLAETYMAFIFCYDLPIKICHLHLVFKLIFTIYWLWQG